MPPTTERDGQGVWRHRWTIGLGAALVLGIAFRLAFPHDIEFKADEAWTAAHVRAFLAGGAAPPVGMPSSAGLANPGLSLWLFLALGRLVGSADPVTLARAVQLSNAAALLLLVGFALTFVARSEREPWLWSAALVAVNPLAVMLQRKLWPPSIFPLFTLALILGWWRRERWWGAFLWGLVGALLGQIELGGFLFAAAFLGVALLGDRRAVRWAAWLAGSLLGALPLLPWAAAVLAGGGGGVGAAAGLRPAFFLDWGTLALGIDFGYSLGQNLLAFLAGPSIAGVETYGTAILVAAAVGIFLALLGRLFQRLHAAPARTVAALFDRRSPTVAVLTAALWGYGLLLTATLRPMYLHYLIVAFAFPALSLAWLARVGARDDFRALAWSRRLLAAMVVVQALLTADFLGYVHATRMIDGDYGTVYGAQTPVPGARR